MVTAFTEWKLDQTGFFHLTASLAEASYKESWSGVYLRKFKYCATRTDMSRRRKTSKTWNCLKHVLASSCRHNCGARVALQSIKGRPICNKMRRKSGNSSING